MTSLALSFVCVSLGAVQVVDARTGAVVAETDGALTLAVAPGEYVLRSASGDEPLTLPANASVSSPGQKITLIDSAAADATRLEADVPPKKLEVTFGVSYMTGDAFTKGVGFAAGFSWRFAKSFAWRAARVSYQLSFETNLRDMLQRDFGVLPNTFGPQPEWMVGSDLVATLWRTGVFKGFQLEVSAALGPSVATVMSVGSRRAGIGGTAELWMNVQLPLARDLNLRLGAGDDLLIQEPYGGPLNTFRLWFAASWRFGAAD